MSLSIEDATRFAQVFKSLVNGVSVAVLDKRQAVRLALTTMFAGGHLLLEDAPGTGKTALARAISAVIDGTHSRIQFTPDLLPSDITGVNMFNQKSGEWVFHAGPVFAEIVLADEINRASPKTQSALLEVMEEAQVTVDGVRRPAPQPFMVIATQNPVEHVFETIDVLYLVNEKVFRPRDSEQGSDEILELFWGFDGSVPVSV